MPTERVTIINARTKLAEILAPQEENDPPVHDNLVDALEPPCMVIGWRVPMIDEWRACNAMAHLTVTLIGGRLEAAPGVEVVEKMYDELQRKLRKASGGWTVQTDGGISVFAIGGQQYLACRVEVQVPIEVS